jgi:DNA excision repair protein ERCC-2
MLELRVGDTDSISRIKKTDESKLQDEYAKLVEGLQEAAPDEDNFMSNPSQDRTPSATAVQLSYVTVLPEDLLKEAIPGNIRKAEHFVAFLKRLVEYLKVSP